MKVKDIMVSEVKSCRTDTNLAAAAHLMWANDCGVLPVVDEEEKVIGMITDRDIAMAVGSRNRAPSEITVFEVKPDPKELFACAPEDEIHTALKTMREHGVRRLPVVNSGRLRGILCMNEIALNASKRGELTYEDVVDTLKAVCEYRSMRQGIAA